MFGVAVARLKMKEFRFLNSPYATSVTHREYREPTDDVTVPDGCWDIVVIKQDGGDTQVLLTGAITRPIPLAFPPGCEVMNITFKPHAFLSLLTGQEMLNEGVFLPKASSKTFWLGSDTFEIPTFENAEGFVDTLLRRQVLANDHLVASIVEGRPMAASERSVQRHFLKTTGMTFKFYKQVRRAEKAMALLQTGMPALQVALALGYSDQSHLIKSLKIIMGRTPKQLQPPT